MKITKKVKKFYKQIFFKPNAYSKDDLRNFLMNPVEGERIFNLFHQFNIIFFSIAIVSFIVFIFVFKNFFFPTLMSLIFILFMISGFRVYILRNKTLDDFEFIYDEEELVPITNNLIEYFTEKRKRRDKSEISFIIDEIEKTKIHNEKYHSYYSFHYTLYFFLSVGLTEIYIFIIIDIILRSALFILNTNLYFLIIFWISFYFSVIFMVRKYHYRNLERAKYLFKRSFGNKLDNLFTKIQRSAFYEEENVYTDKFVNLLNEWFRLYKGFISKEEKDKEKLLFQYREYYIGLEEREKFHQVLKSLIAKVKNERERLNYKKKLGDLTPLNGKFERIELIIAMINQFLENLEYEINFQKKKEEEKRNKIGSFRDKIAILTGVSGLIIAIIAIIF